MTFLYIFGYFCHLSALFSKTLDLDKEVAERQYAHDRPPLITATKNGDHRLIRDL